ncbi:MULTISPECIES: hypothetical protein [Desulfosporosinus]|uniref:Uncharacterized protein n=1 Tax=Desulfosporosinus acididurans TaxID=476652 RepID=A0A0J1II93_9FIRM|nr:MULTISPECIES: hypothetical protein [Desulfosporosinus]KLU64421.1 hypothetical protein DEAC_c36230 [Desulfosporosinus acididurans]
MKYSFITSFSVEECENKIDHINNINDESISIISSPHQIAKINRKNNTFWTSSPNLARDAFPWIFKGQFTKTNEGTLINGEFSLSKFVLTIAIAWELLAFYVLLTGIETNHLKVILAAFVMTTGILLLLFAGINMKRQMIIDFIIKTYEAKTLTPNSIDLPVLSIKSSKIRYVTEPRRQ